MRRCAPPCFSPSSAGGPAAADWGWRWLGESPSSTGAAWCSSRPGPMAVARPSRCACLRRQARQVAAGAGPGARAREGTTGGRAMADILIVDDEVKLGKLLAESLASQGHQVVRAGSGAEALGRMETHQLDLVVTDLRMPGTDWRGSPARGQAAMAGHRRRGDDRLRQRRERGGCHARGRGRLPHQAVRPRRVPYASGAHPRAPGPVHAGRGAGPPSG